MLVLNEYLYSSFMEQRDAYMRLKDFNNLKPWLTKMCRESNLPIYKLANRAEISRAVIYAWMADRYRPDSKTLLRVSQVFAEHTGRKSEDIQAEGLATYTPRVEGRPLGTKLGPRFARART